MNAAEDRLSELMDAATRALAPPIDSILAEGERLGRRRRRRRRAAVATGTAAVVLLAGAGAAAGLRYARVDVDDVAAGRADAVHHTPVHPASRAPTAGAASAVPSGAATPSPAPTLTVEMVPITSAAAVEILKLGGLGAWKLGTYDPTNAARTSLLDFDVNDGKGISRVFVGIGTTADSGMDPANCALQTPLLVGGGKRPTDAPAAGCKVQDYPNGDRVMQEVLKADAYGEYQYRIIAYRSDGVAVEITAANGDYSSVSTEVTRVEPPLSMAQWTAIALDRSWQLSVPFTFSFGGASPTP